jgi:hypothetical protein
MIAFFLGCAEDNTKDIEELRQLFSLMGNKNLGQDSRV